MDKERWKIQNRLYRMKARKLELENFIKQTEKDIKFLKEFNFFKIDIDDKDVKLRHYLLVYIFFCIAHLDKIFDFYYMRYKCFNYIKNAKKEILTLTKEIKLYEYKL